jgi:hypothetical protein
MMVSMITPRRQLSVPCETLIAPRGALIVRRGTLSRLLAEATVLWPKRNMRIVGCNPTARCCECHLPVDYRHQHTDCRHGDGTSRHLALNQSASRSQPSPPCVVQGDRNAEPAGRAFRSVHAFDDVLTHQTKRLANAGDSGAQQRLRSTLSELESYTTDHRSARSLDRLAHPQPESRSRRRIRNMK